MHNLTLYGSAVLAWLIAHPAVDMATWPIVTAGINLAFKDASEYADSHPRWAPVKKLLQKYGVSPRGTIALVVAAAKARGLPGPSADSTVEVAVPVVPPKGS